MAALLPHGTGSLAAKQQTLNAAAQVFLII